MQVTSSALTLIGNQHKSEQTIERERLVIERDNRRPPATPTTSAQDKVHISDHAARSQPMRAQGEVSEEGAEPLVKTKMRALIQFVEALTGKKMELFDAKELGDDRSPASPGQGNPPGNPPVRIEYDYYAARIEEEHTAFSAQGIVKTADGREINIELQLNMSRRFMEEQSIQIRTGEQRLKDPLVLNFSGNAAQLSESTFTFDLDSDGREDQVAVLGPNSGFLALDKNGDGTINDGSELFGTQSGNGFADLARYDQDGNQWIDEGDDIYSQLRIWSRDSDGNEQLFALGQKGVGAIYLGNVATQFDLKDSSNALQGQVVSSGLFLKEDGGVGTAQQIDLVV